VIPSSERPRHLETGKSIARASAQTVVGCVAYLRML
jgi:hypothetical protein